MMTVAGFSSFYEENPLAVWAAVGATVVLAPLSTFLFGKTANKSVPPFLSAADWKDVTLTEKKSESPTVRRLTCVPGYFAEARCAGGLEACYLFCLVVKAAAAATAPVVLWQCKDALQHLQKGCELEA